MAAIEATDRYGGNWPDPATVCEGPCEGTGVYPAYSEKYDEHRKAVGPTLILAVGIDDTAAIEAAGVTPGADGWAFLKCPDCKGTGLR